jgi:hypothetical protein
MQSALWTVEDVKNGDCLPFNLGELKPLATMHEAQSAEHDADSPTPPSAPLELTAALQAAYIKMGSEKAFVSWAQKNPNMVYPMIAKLGITNIAKVEAPPTKTLDSIPDEELAAMPSLMLKRLLLASANIETQSALDYASSMCNTKAADIEGL